MVGKRNEKGQFIKGERNSPASEFKKGKTSCFAGRKHTDESKKLMREKKLGTKASEQTKKKMKESSSHYWKGKKLSEETRKKMSDANKKRNWKGSNHPRWKGGLDKEKVLMKNRKIRVKKMGCSGYHTLSDWETLKAQYDWTCPCCKKREPLIKLQEDHVIPLSKGGSDNIENIQPLCPSCNNHKHTKIIKY